MKGYVTFMKFFLKGIVVLALGVVLVGTISAAPATANWQVNSRGHTTTTTPITHLVVIFDENVSFDHYFGIYPYAKNTPGEPQFKASQDTPSVNGLNTALLTDNPNSANPIRLDRSQALTCDQNHSYLNEQLAFDHGLMDRFVQSASGGSCTDKSIVMDYYDGNTVTALWNYAQRFAMSDNSYDTVFGPSTPGALNLVSGQTHGATPAAIPNDVSNGTMIGDARPVYDDCSVGEGGPTAGMSGSNVGDLLNAKGVTWGWFQGGFKPTSMVNGAAVCAQLTRISVATQSPTTSRTTSRFSTTSPLPIHTTCRPLR